MIIMAAKPGPKPLPKNVHMLRGNPSKLSSAALFDDCIRPATEIPSAPEHLSLGALEEWGRITVELEKLGLVSQIDRAALAVYCQAYGRWVLAENKLKELDGAGLVDTSVNGYKQIGVWLQISNRAVDQMKSFLTEFGMTPSARSRVTPSSPQGDLFGNDNGYSQSKNSKPDYFGPRQ